MSLRQQAIGCTRNMYFANQVFYQQFSIQPELGKFKIKNSAVANFFVCNKTYFKQ